MRNYPGKKKTCIEWNLIRMAQGLYDKTINTTEENKYLIKEKEIHCHWIGSFHNIIGLI